MTSRLKIKNSKTKKRNYINNFQEKVFLKERKTSTFLSSCFQYYYGNILICNKKCKELVLSNSFLETKYKGPLVIIDYPNVIHILYEKYKDKNQVIKNFYQFICSQLHKSTKFYIIAKKVVIDDISLDIETVFNQGYKLTGLLIEKKYFDNEHINIYNLSYTLKEKISSSIDDLLGYFICFVLYAYLSNSNINPNENTNPLFNKINIITNDKQFFNKNLFGLTEDERENHVNIAKDLTIEKLMLNHKHYFFINNKLDQKLLSSFLNEYVITFSNNTRNLECKLFTLLQILHNSISKKNTLDFFSYENLNQLQKKYLEKYKHKSSKKCPTLGSLVDGQHNLIKYYYLYTFIKYVQIHTHTYTKNGKQFGEFYGSQPKDEIVTLFSN